MTSASLEGATCSPLPGGEGLGVRGRQDDRRRRCRRASRTSRPLSTPLATAPSPRARVEIAAPSAQEIAR